MGWELLRLLRRQKHDDPYLNVKYANPKQKKQTKKQKKNAIK
jgi:hypothetical protein